MGRAVIYCRLSPTPRGEEAKGGNLEDQEARCRAHAERKGHEIVAVVTEKDTSATSRKVRKGWQRAVGMVRAGDADTIVARNYDRMYRQVGDLEELVRLAEDTGAVLEAAESDGMGLDLTTATGRAQARYMAVGAQLEAEMKAERQRMGHERRSSAGKPFWNTRPFGFECDGAHRPSEAPVLEGIYHDLLAGHTLWGIARRMNRAGITTVKGRQWTSSKVRQVVLHPRNAGVHTYTPTKSGRKSRDALVSGSEASWDPIVSMEVYEAVRTLLGAPERRTGGDGRRKGLLVGIATCAECGAGMGQGWNKPRADGSRLRKYRCTGDECGTIPADWLDDYVINRIILNADIIVSAQLGEAEEAEEVDVTALRAEEVRLRARKDQLVEDEIDGLIDRAQMLAGTRKLNARLEELAERLTAAMTSRTTAERWRADVEAMFERLGDDLDDPARHDELRAVIRDATTHVRVRRGRKGERHPGPHRVDVGLKQQKGPRPEG